MCGGLSHSHASPSHGLCLCPCCGSSRLLTQMCCCPFPLVGPCPFANGSTRLPRGPCPYAISLCPVPRGPLPVPASCCPRSRLHLLAPTPRPASPHEPLPYTPSSLARTPRQSLPVPVRAMSTYTSTALLCGPPALCPCPSPKSFTATHPILRSHHRRLPFCAAGVTDGCNGTSGPLNAGVRTWELPFLM